MQRSNSKVCIRRQRGLASSLLLVLVLGSGASFGAGAQSAPERALADLVINGVKDGAIQFTIDERSDMLLSTFDLGEGLKDILRSEIAASLMEKDRLASVTELSMYGIEISFDKPNLVLNVTVSPESMKPGLLAAREEARTGKGEKGFKPAGVAATVGADLEIDPIVRTFGAEGYFSWSAKARLTPSLSALGFVAEADATFNFDPLGYSANLDGARLIKDFPRLGARLRAGIVDIPIVAFQSGKELYGLSFGREASLPGAAPGSVDANQQVVVRSDADIRVYVNGVFTRQLRLPPGSYRLTDLPLASGLNEVRVEISERGMAPRQMRLGIPYDQGLLGFGKLDYSLVLGLARNEFSEPFGAAHAALGLSDKLQLGLNAEAGNSAALAGASALAATWVGTIGVDGDISLAYAHLSEPSAAAYAFRAYWRFSSLVDGSLPRAGAAAEYREPGFAAPGAANATLEPTWAFSGQLGIPLPGRIGLLSVSGNATRAGGVVSDWSITIGPTLNFFKSTMLSFSCGYDWKASSGGTPRAALFLTVAPPNRRTMTYQRDLLSQSDSVNLSFGFGEDDTASITGRDILGDNPEVNFSGTIRTPIATFAGSGDIARDIGANFSGASGSASMSTALVFADGFAALTRTPEKALALVVPDERLKRQLIEIRPDEGAPTRSPNGGTMVISGLTPYKKFVARVELPQSSPDSRPDPASIEFTPVYGSITIVTIGQASSMTARGTLVRANGKVVANVAGDLFDAEGRSLGIGATFTDERGVFECFGLPKGKFTVKWGDGSHSSLEMPDGEAGAIIDLGDIVAMTEGGNP